MTSNYAVCVGWNRAVSGREAASVELFGQFTNYLTRLQKDKKIDNYEPVFLDAHGGTVNGFILIRGGADGLTEMRRSDEWQDFIIQGNYIMQGFSVTEAVLGEALADRMKRFHKVVTR